MPSKKSFLNAGYKLDDLITFTIKRNNCVYRWAIPLKDWEVVAEFNDATSPDLLLSKGAVLLDILATNMQEIDFHAKSGVKKLSVYFKSSESEDRQLLHKLAGDLGEETNESNSDSIPGTK